MDASVEGAQRRLVPSPAWLQRLEQALGSRIPLHPNLISAVKLLVVTPLVILSLRQLELIPGGPRVAVAAFLAFAALDYLDGVVARARGLATAFGRIFDRVCDYPLLFVFAGFCLEVLPAPLVAVKLGLDLLLFVLYLLGRGSTQNRLRTVMSYATLLSLFFLSQGLLPHLLTPKVVTALLAINIAFTSLVVAHNLDLLQKRFLADLLSATNLACGIFSMHFASHGRFEISLLFLLLGAACDGLDGAAARRWGGTRWGVYSDDVADAVNYGLAPGVVLAFALGGLEGVAIGAAYAIFTIGRLVYFTLNKAGSDPAHFAGAPSTVGALIAICAAILFPHTPALTGLLVGVACAQMVSFTTPYLHLGRRLEQEPRVLRAAPAYLLLLLVGGLAFGLKGTVALILLTNLVYGFLPALTAFRRLLALRAGRHPGPT
ncbi:MAG: CDP-alcohol phosphatidyltransferase family protein [Deltaproteobacteria bacterium]|nr:CDP-alcohol phosphatidyltransferase family protein [Deltaproteobacteria bacterium]